MAFYLVNFCTLAILKILGFKVMQGATSGYLFNQVVRDV